MYGLIMDEYISRVMCLVWAQYEQAHLCAHIEHIPRTLALHVCSMSLACALNEPCMCVHVHWMGVVCALDVRAYIVSGARRHPKIPTLPYGFWISV